MPDPLDEAQQYILRAYPGQQKWKGLRGYLPDKPEWANKAIEYRDKALGALPPEALMALQFATKRPVGGTTFPGLAKTPVGPPGGLNDVAAPRATLPKSAWQGENLARDIDNVELPKPSSLMGKVEAAPKAPMRDYLPSDFKLETSDRVGRSGDPYWRVGLPSSTDPKILQPVITAKAIETPNGQKVLRIIESSLPDNMRNKGAGIAAYQRMIDEAHDRGYEVRSDTTLSPDSARIYPALAARGYQVDRNPVAKENIWGGISGNGPVFTVRPKPDLDQAAE